MKIGKKRCVKLTHVSKLLMIPKWNMIILHLSVLSLVVYKAQRYQNKTIGFMYAKPSSPTVSMSRIALKI